MAKYSWILAATAQEMRKFIQYRAEFWIVTIGLSLSQLVIAFSVWNELYSSQGQTTLGTYTLNEAILYSVWATLCGTALRPIFGVISREIYEGDLTKYLMYPVSHYLLCFTLYFGKSFIAFLQATIAIGAVVLVSPNIEVFDNLPPIWSISAGIVSLFLSMILIYSSNYIVELTGFWADEVWALSIFHHFVVNIFGGTVLPLTFFPDWAQSILYVLPPAVIFAVPIETFMGRVTPSQWLMNVGLATIWIIVLIPIRRIIWELGRKQYSGVGM